ncbi:hypothetical protein WR25_11466 [Diploscapter pachys]|uniref:Mitochondrial fission 1 protein n=1 Tax=Diploscapter pachys TaxID=2018661 RepID=A0A2A2J6G7_9BILA|nr:hypothetical protein WR25_11466 [Diploscapter pachys]
MISDIDTILDERVDPFDLEKSRYDYEKQVGRGSPSSLTTFIYANALIRSTKEDVHEGINLLEKLLHDEPDNGAKRDYVYHLAIANARLKDYDRALAYIDALLTHEQSNRQAQRLKEVIEKKMRKEGLIGAAIVGTGALVLGGLAALLFAGRK